MSRGPAGPPCRIGVLGNSVPILVVPPRTAREQGNYPEQLERRLLAAGLPVEVRNHSRLFELIHEGGPRFRHELSAAMPDVLVVHYGILELQPNVLPTPVVRHLTRIERSGRGLRGVWLRHGVPAVWPRARAYQRWASARAGLRTWRLQPKRFAAELSHLAQVAGAAKSLLLVVDVHQPNQRLEHFMPGIGRRWERYQTMLRDTVAAIDSPEVRLVESSAVVDAIGLERGTADGLHLTPEAHGLLADRLADEIQQWWVGGYQQSQVATT